VSRLYRSTISEEMAACQVHKQAQSLKEGLAMTDNPCGCKPCGCLSAMCDNHLGSILDDMELEMLLEQADIKNLSDDADYRSLDGKVLKEEEIW